MKNPSSKDVKNVAALGGGVLVGNLVTPAINGAILDAAKVTSNNAKAGILAVICVAAGFSAAYVKGTGIGEAIGKGALIGLSGTSGAEAIKALASKTPAVQKLAAKSDAIGKAVGRISGLGCACGQSHEAMLNGARRNKRRGRGMGMYLPPQEFVYPLNGSSNSLESIVNGGGLLSA